MASYVLIRQRACPEQAFDVPMMVRARFTMSQVITQGSSRPTKLNIVSSVLGFHRDTHTVQHGIMLGVMKAKLHRIPTPHTPHTPHKKI